MPKGTELPPLSDSFWFWGCVFATAALVALVLAGPKYRYRQVQLENRFLARQQAGQTNVGDRGPIQPSTADRTIISLKPLYMIGAGLLIGAWGSLLWQRTRLRHRLAASAEHEP